MSERTIRITENGRVIYEGPEHRRHQNMAVVQPSRFWGMSAETWIKVVGFIIAGVIFWYRTETFMSAQIELNKYVLEFAKRSDSYHSAKTGQVFEQGAPGTFKFQRAGQNNFTSSLAHAAENSEE